jgi:hypothetical protein
MTDRDQRLKKKATILHNLIGNHEISTLTSFKESKKKLSTQKIIKFYQLTIKRFLLILTLNLSWFYL